jgi:hypothetical protein
VAVVGGGDPLEERISALGTVAANRSGHEITTEVDQDYPPWQPWNGPRIKGNWIVPKATSDNLFSLKVDFMMK